MWHMYKNNRLINKSIVAFLAVFCMGMSGQAQAGSRIKDIVTFEGVRDNMLMGYGLVVGLNGTGDKLNNAVFTQESLVAFLERQGVNTRGTNLKTKNVAAVSVTATLPPFARSGSHLDVTVSAMGDASNLQGGTLLATSLYGADGEVYAVGQGAISVGGFRAEGAATTITKGVPTQGFVPNGGIVEREIPFQLNNMDQLKLALRNPDITTARTVAEAINAQVGPGTAEVLDPATVQLTVPPVYKQKAIQLLADIEQLPIETDQPARIVIDESSGTIVIGEDVRINTVAVAQGNLSIRVQETPQISQPNPLAPAGSQTVQTTVTDVTVNEEPGRRMAVLQKGTTLKELVAGLNALGVGPRDLISILQTVKASGALQANIEVR